MKNLHAAAAVLSAVTALSAAVLQAQGGAAPTPDQLEANKRVVMEFYRPGITPEERIALIHPDYQQHNQAYVKYAKDRNISNWQAFAEIRRQQGVDQAAAAARARDLLAARGPVTPPQTPVGNTFHILYAEGELVVRIAQRWTPDPDSPMSFYETFWWDTFQVRDGKLYQHWDGGVIAEPNAPRNAGPPAANSTVPVVWPPAQAVPAPGCTATPAQVTENKRIATRFFQTTGEERLALVDPTYIQHNPVFRRNALRSRMTDYETVKAAITAAAAAPRPAPQAATGPQPPAGNMLERVVGACDIVTIIHKVYRQDPTASAGTFYDTYSWDTFRVRNGKLVEHWDGATLPRTSPEVVRTN